MKSVIVCSDFMSIGSGGSEGAGRDGSWLKTESIIKCKRAGDRFLKVKEDATELCTKVKDKDLRVISLRIIQSRVISDLVQSDFERGIFDVQIRFTRFLFLMFQKIERVFFVIFEILNIFDYYWIDLFKQFKMNLLYAILFKFLFQL